MDGSCHGRSTRDVHVSGRGGAVDCGPEARGGTGGGETRDTKPCSDLVFRDSALGHWGTRGRQSKRLRTAHEMLQVGHSNAGPVAVGSGDGAAAACCRGATEGAREALCAGLIGATTAPRPCTRASHTPFRLFAFSARPSHWGHTSHGARPGAASVCCSARPGSQARGRPGPTRSRRGSLVEALSSRLSRLSAWAATGPTRSRGRT